MGQVHQHHIVVAELQAQTAQELDGAQQRFERMKAAVSNCQGAIQALTEV
jgi:hypothetical protein